MTRRHAGFSLIELMIVGAILGLASVYMLGSVATTNHTYAMVEQVTESQQALRAAADLLERDLRHAGLMIPEGAAVCAVDNDGAPDVLYISDAEALDPQSDLTIYSGASLAGSSVSSGVIVLGSLIIEPSPPLRAAYDADGDGTNDSDFQAEAGVIFVDVAETSRGTACGSVDSVNTGASSISVTIASDALGASGGGAQLVAVPAHRYRIVNGDQLKRNSMTVAEGIEDFQVVFWLDLNDDGQVGGGEILGDGSGANDYSSTDSDIATLREMRFNLVGRTRNEDRNLEGKFQAKENRDPSNTTDGYRRRVHTSHVRIRNLGARVGS